MLTDNIARRHFGSKYNPLMIAKVSSIVPDNHRLRCKTFVSFSQIHKIQVDGQSRTTSFLFSKSPFLTGFALEEI